MSRRLVTVLPSPRPRIASVGTASPQWRYSQQTIADLLAVPDGIGRRFFQTSGIEGRNLCLEPTADDRMPDEDQADLLTRHRRAALELGRVAIDRCLTPQGLNAVDIDFLCCVTSTGFTMPGLTAMYVRHLGFRHDCQRIDIVAMGCNAALNGLNVTTSWSAANPGRHALLVCCEINSAIHVRDDRVVTSLVNSLFGDGFGALLLSTDGAGLVGPEVLGFSSHIVPSAWRAISYHWSREHGKFELHLDKDIPHVLGEHSPAPISALLSAFTLCRCDVSHWLVHAGGKKVISAVREANGLTPHDMRHASDILAQAGNLGSATVIFSYEALMHEAAVAPGDYGVLVTMGPGATIESALLQWPSSLVS
jgi:3,5-dihydroxyphenylacetyl-CoA synthase